MMPRDPAGTAGPPDAALSRRLLFGADHEQPGTAVTAAVGERVALGLARGWFPKPYAYVDPNEDVVAAVAGDAAQLLVVADGHNGREASHAAVSAVVDAWGDGPVAPAMAEGAVVDLLTRVEDRVDAVADRGRARSRTTLIVALRSRDTLQWCSVGDSALLVVAGRRPRLLTSRTRWFVGDRVSRDVMARTMAAGTIDLAATAWVVVATDGYTDYTPDGLDASAAVASAVVGARGADAAVDALLDQARRGGAGDNVGVVVSGPWEQSW